MIKSSFSLWYSHHRDHRSSKPTQIHVSSLLKKKHSPQALDSSNPLKKHKKEYVCSGVRGQKSLHIENMSVSVLKIREI